MNRYCLFWLGLLLVFYACHSSDRPEVQVSFSKKVVPVFIRATENPVLCIEVDNDSNKELQVTSFTLLTESRTLLKDVDRLSLYFTGLSPEFDSRVLFGFPQKGTEKSIFEGKQILKPGKNYFWASVHLTDSADLKNKINVRCSQIEIPGFRPIFPDTVSFPPSRIGYAVRLPQDDGCAAFRIPGLVCTPRGTLIAVYDARWNSAVDLQADIDVCISRSIDQGRHWLPMQKAIDMKNWGGKPEKENGVGDPAILVDPQTGRIWIAALWLHGKPGQRAWWSSEAGLSPEKTGQLLLTYSDDDGASWSEPVSITPQIKKPEWTLCFNGPGRGITTRNGTLVFAGQFKDKDQIPYSTIIYSQDKGKTWHIGNGAKSNTTEAQVAELQDGSLMLNMRDNRGGSRSIAITKNSGSSWEEHPSSSSALPEPVCQASLLRISLPDGKPALAFFNPDSQKERECLTLKLSFDDGETWPEKYHTLFYEPDGYGYSCLTQIDSTTLGVLYEGAGELYFQQIDLQEILRK